jgi:hypothetical protein
MIDSSIIAIPHDARPAVRYSRWIACMALNAE